MSNITRNNKEKIFEGKIDRRYKNYTLLMIFCLASIGLLFLSLSLSYFFNVRTNRQANLNFPILIYVNTIVIIFSSIALVFQEKYFAHNIFKKYIITNIIFYILVFLFITLQITIWFTLSNNGFNFKHNSSAFLFLISGFHVLHLLGGIIFLSYFTKSHWHNLHNNITALVFFTDKTAYFQLKLFAYYWHFLTLVWIYLFFFFLIVK